MLAPLVFAMQLTILHTNDVHGHIEGSAALSSMVEQIRKNKPNVLLLDAGDAIGDTAIAGATKGRAVIEHMNRVGYDVMTLGNHEPDFGMQALRERVADAKFDVVAANVVEAGTKKTFVKPYVLKKTGGETVAVIGLGYPKTPLTTAKKNVEGYEFLEPVEVLGDAIRRARGEGATFVVVLSHLGLNGDLKLGAQVQGIDVIVGGHSHNRVTTPIRVGRTVVVQAGAHLSDLGRLDLTLEKGRIVDVKGQLLPVQASVASDDAVIATATAPLVRAQTIAGPEPRKRNEESPADSLFADLIREQTRSDVALLPGVGYGVPIPAGPITRTALKNLVPHESKVVSMLLSGTALKAVLEQAVENVYGSNPVGGMIQVSGVTFTYNPAAKFGSRVTDVRIGNEPLDAGRDYRVATNSMLAEGGHRYDELARGAGRQEHAPQYDVIEQALRARKSVAPPPIGRIKQK